MINVIYEDNHLLVVEKPINIPTQEDNTKDSKEQKEGDEYNDFESNVDHLDNQSKTSSQKEEVKVEQ